MTMTAGCATRENDNQIVNANVRVGERERERERENLSQHAISPLND